MKKIYALIPLASLALLAACAPGANTITGSGRLVTHEVDISGFDSVDVSNAFQVDVRQGDAYRVVVRIDDNLLDRLIVEKQGRELKIGLQSDWGVSIRRFTGKAEVTLPSLVRLELSGACRGTIGGFVSESPLEVRVSGASQLSGDVRAGDARFDASGASQMNLKGSADDLDVEASGASEVDLSGFAVRNAAVDASGASQVTLDASGTLDVEASGASLVRYVGDPRIGRLDLSGSSSIKAR